MRCAGRFLAGGISSLALPTRVGGTERVKIASRRAPQLDSRLPSLTWALGYHLGRWVEPVRAPDEAGQSHVRWCGARLAASAAYACRHRRWTQPTKRRRWSTARCYPASIPEADNEILYRTRLVASQSIDGQSCTVPMPRHNTQPHE